MDEGGLRMAIVYMAKQNDKPIGFYSNLGYAKNVSPEIEELDIPLLDGCSKDMIYYASATYTTLCMNDGSPISTSIQIGPTISRSANVALTELFNKATQKHVFNCSLEHLYCCKIDSDIESTSVDHIEENIYHSIFNPYASVNCSIDPLIQQTWNMLMHEQTWDLDHLALPQIVKVLSRDNRIVLHERSCFFSRNLLVQQLVDMSEKEVAVCMLVRKNVPELFARVDIDGVGLMAFFEKNAFIEASSDFEDQATIREKTLGSVLDAFETDPEHGIYFVNSFLKA